MIVATAANNETWHVLRQCEMRLDGYNAGRPCGDWYEMNHYGLPTNIICCGVHNGLYAGEITR